MVPQLPSTVPSPLASLLGCLLAASLQTAAQEENSHWIPLFNGTNLDGWVDVQVAPETFTVNDGMIICSGVPTGVMRTDRQYENFELELEYRHMIPGGNAGLFIWSYPLTAPGVPFTRSIEVQVLDGRNSTNATSHGDIFSIHGATLTPDRPHPGGWARSLPTERRANPAGHWNHYFLRCVDGAIQLAVNGKIVSSVHGCIPRKGYICLESEGGLVHFRNIRIKELSSTNPSPEETAPKAEGFQSLYNGLNLQGWQADRVDEGDWQARDWTLRSAGKSAAQGSHLWTSREFRDFTLICDWRFSAKPAVQTHREIGPDGRDLRHKIVEVPDAGESGIFLRGSTHAQVNIWCHPAGSGELHGYRTAAQAPASLRKAAVPAVQADRAPGLWNRFEITLLGSVLTVRLNDQVVIDSVTLPDLPAVGPIGLEHQGRPVEFANIYIKELQPNR